MFVPFTLFHLGPSLALGLPLRRKLHLPTFLVASVAVDVEPFLVFLFGLDYPLHGYLHTFLLALPYGVMIGYIMFLFERYLGDLWHAVLLEEGFSSKSPFIVGGVFGTISHVLLDAPLYSDIRPFYPLGVNPIYDPSVTEAIYAFCAVSFLMGIVEHFLILARGAKGVK